MSYNKELDIYIGYIYKITNKVNGKSYIGQTTQPSIQIRYNQHIKSAISNKDNSMALPRAIRKYGIENFEICELHKIQSKSKEELLSILNDLEIKSIKQYQTLITQNGYNITLGGNNVTQKSKTMVDKYSTDGDFIDSYESAIDACRYNSIPENGYRNILSCCSGKKRIAYGYVWRYSNEPFNQHHTRKNIIKTIPIDVYDLAGNFICSFEDIHDAIGILDEIYSVQEIKNCCKGIKSCYKRYIFRYMGEPLDKYILKRQCKNKTVYCYDLKGNFLQEFENSTIATNYLASKNISAIRKNINKCASGKSKTAYGFKWYYEYNRPISNEIIKEVS